jgi:hypothetical protein
MALLQNCMGCVEGETGSCSETCTVCAVDRPEEVNVKVEETLDIKDEILGTETFPSFQAEHEVRLQRCV